MAWSEFESPLVPPVAFRSPVDPRYDLLRAQVFEKRSVVRWEMVSQCACSNKAALDGVDTESGEYDPDCVQCKGRGLFHHTPRIIPAMVTDATTKPEWFAHYGLAMRGMARFTMLPEHLPGPLDRLTVVDSTIRMPHRGVRAPGAVTALTYPVVKRLIEHALGNSWTYGDYDQKKVAGTIELGVLYCRRADAAGRIVANELVEGVDFVINTKGEIDWTLGDALGTAPAVGARFVCEFTTHPVYMVQTIPHTFRDRYTSPADGGGERRSQSNVHVDAYLEFWGPPGG